MKPSRFQRAAVLSFALAVSASCTRSEQSPDHQDEIGTLGEEVKKGRLVQGRQKCIEGLVQDGAARADAEKSCNDAFAQVMANKAATPNAAPTADDGAIWFLLGYMSGGRPVSAYTQDSSGILRHAGGFRDGSIPGAIGKNQSEYLRAPTGQRESVATRIGAQQQAARAAAAQQRAAAASPQPKSGSPGAAPNRGSSPSSGGGFRGGSSGSFSRGR